jgi:restriction system protein
MGFYREIRHNGLRKYRVVTGVTTWIVAQKAAAQLATWDDEWRRKIEKDRRSELKLAKARTNEEKKAYAAGRTQEIVSEIEALGQTLHHCLTHNTIKSWDVLKVRSTFTIVPPTEPKEPILPTQPNTSDLKYRPRITLMDRILIFPRKRKETAAAIQYRADYEKWRAEYDAISDHNATTEKRYKEILGAWQRDRDDFALREQARIESLQSLQDDYQAKKQRAIEEYCELVLSGSEYPDNFPRSCEVEYRPETKVLVLDYALPAPEVLPKAKEIRYVQSRDELQEIPLSDSEKTKLYDNLLYQIVLRSIFELYKADGIEAIELVTFNGFVRSIDRTTGNEVNACVLSLQAGRAEFSAINLANVDPKACFKRLKGVGSSKLIGLAPVAPIAKMCREDPRFVPAHDVADTIEAGSNIAAMDWEEFEHFIRELFSKVFEKDGGEVKVTRANRDGGVDAIAFDPDPIRGGKIVIQAKRYTNTVQVSAVRDLYGTVVNEGATKGILVTTADYGPDSYEFARDKPLTLINGNQLLYLLREHGHSYRIDLKEAKKILAEQQ